MPYLRTEIEQMIMATDGRVVHVGNQETAGHFVVEPQVELEGRVLGDVPTLLVPQMMAGLRIGETISVELTAEDVAQLGVENPSAGIWAFVIAHRTPGSAPGETRLVLEVSGAQ